MKKKLSVSEFFACIWPSSLLTNEMLELRIIERKDQTITRKFFTSAKDLIQEAAKYKNKDVYFGVSTKFGRGGKKKDCYRTRVVWADLDGRNIDDCNFESKPDLVVDSGGGTHAYWILKTPLLVRGEGWKELESINRGLAEAFGGDVAAIDVSRILRVPGCQNTKYNPPRTVTAYAL